LSKAELVIADGDAEARDFKSELKRIENENDVQKLMAQLHKCLTLTVENMVKVGAIVRRLDEMELDLSSLGIPNVALFRRIAHGGMLPEVFVNLSGTPRIMRKVSCLPIPDQRAIVKGTSLKVMLRGGDHMLIAVADMTDGQASQVFARDHIRSDSQQSAWLHENEQRAEMKKAKPPEVMVDKRRHGITIGDVFLSADDLVKLLGQLAKK